MKWRTITLTAGADSIPGLIGSDGTTDTSGDDTIVATDTTLTAGDRLTDDAGMNSLDYFQSSAGAVSKAAFTMAGVQTMNVTADGNQLTDSVRFDLSGTTGLEQVNADNSTVDVAFNQLTSLVNVGVESATSNANVTVQYQNTVVAGDDTVALTLSATDRANSDIGRIRLGSVADDNGGIETLAIAVAGADTVANMIDSDVTNVTITGDEAGSSLTVDTYLNSTVRSVEATEFTGSLDLAVGLGVAETAALTVALGSGADRLAVAGGQLDVNLGAGDDTILFDTRDNFNNTNNKGFRADDSVNGGEGVDTLQLGFFDPDDNPWTPGSATGNGGSFTLSTTEFNNKESLEVIDVRALETNMTPSQAFVDTAEQTLLVTSDRVNEGYTDAADISAANIAEASMTTTLDTTALSQNTPLNYVGGDGSDRIVLNDATFNSAIDLDGGSEWNADSGPAGAGDYDTLTINGGSTQTQIDASDLTNIKNFEGLNLVKTGAATTIDLTLTQAFLNANTDANDDVTNTSIDDRVFQIFSAASGNAVALGGGDTVNIEIGNLVGATLAGRGFDFTSLLASGATVNFEVNGAAATAAQINAVTVVDNAGRPDVIASRANPTAVNALDTTTGVDGIIGLGRDIQTSQATLQPFDNIIAGGFDLDFNGAVTPPFAIDSSAGQTFQNVSGVGAINLADGVNNTATIVDAGMMVGGAGVLNTGNGAIDTISSTGANVNAMVGAGETFTVNGNDTGMNVNVAAIAAAHDLSALIVNGGTGVDTILMTGIGGDDISTAFGGVATGLSVGAGVETMVVNNAGAAMVGVDLSDNMASSLTINNDTNVAFAAAAFDATLTNLTVDVSTSAAGALVDFSLATGQFLPLSTTVVLGAANGVADNVNVAATSIVDTMTNIVTIQNFEAGALGLDTITTSLGATVTDVIGVTIAATTAGQFAAAVNQALTDGGYVLGIGTAGVDAYLVEVTGGTLAGLYAVVDSDASFSVNTGDEVVALTGLTGTLTNVDFA